VILWIAMETTRVQYLRYAITNEEADLRRFEANTAQNVDSIKTTKRNLERYEAELALYPPD
jgi:predicted DNA-binding protein YlxM (UPF0122 family)